MDTRLLSRVFEEPFLQPQTLLSESPRLVELTESIGESIQHLYPSRHPILKVFFESKIFRNQSQVMCGFYGSDEIWVLEFHKGECRSVKNFKHDFPECDFLFQGENLSLITKNIFRRLEWWLATRSWLQVKT